MGSFFLRRANVRTIIAQVAGNIPTAFSYRSVEGDMDTMTRTTETGSSQMTCDVCEERAALYTVVLPTGIAASVCSTCYHSIPEVHDAPGFFVDHA